MVIVPIPTNGKIVLSDGGRQRQHVRAGRRAVDVEPRCRLIRTILVAGDHPSEDGFIVIVQRELMLVLIVRQCDLEQ